MIFLENSKYSIFVCLFFFNYVICEPTGTTSTADFDLNCKSYKTCLNDESCGYEEFCFSSQKCGKICREFGDSKCEACTIQDCPYGLSTERDENGCFKCECKTCASCTTDCIFGYEMKSDGCPSCKCRDNPCKTMDCKEDEKCRVMEAEPSEIPTYPYGKCEKHVLGDCFKALEAHYYVGRKEGLYYYDILSDECKEISSNFKTASFTFKTKEICEKICGFKPCPELDCQTPCKVIKDHRQGHCPTCICPENTFRTCPELTCKKSCSTGFKIDQYGCSTCECNKRLMPDDCYLDPDPGNCRAAITRYYYNKSDKMCSSFIYGGCGGNNNNFPTMSECFDSCSESPCAVPMCSDKCKFGRVLSKEGCETCKCADRYYCENVQCAKGYVCVAQDTCKDGHQCQTSFQCHPKGTVNPFIPPSHKQIFCGFTAIGTLAGFIVTIVLILILIVFGVLIIVFKGKFIQQSKMCIKAADEKTKIAGKDYVMIDNDATITPTDEKKVPLA